MIRLNQAGLCPASSLPFLHDLAVMTGRVF